jgi:hypothetical protein
MKKRKLGNLTDNLEQSAAIIAQIVRNELELVLANYRSDLKLTHELREVITDHARIIATLNRGEANKQPAIQIHMDQATAKLSVGDIDQIIGGHRELLKLPKSGGGTK